MTTALYALSADPITNGHLWVIQCAARMFSKVMVGIGQNPDKKCVFSIDERFYMTREVICQSALSNCEVRCLQPDDWTVKVAKDLGHGYLVRGVRNARDFEYEMELANFNRVLEPAVQTVLLPTPPHLSQVSSSFVKGLVGLRDWEDVVSPLVPVGVLDHLVKWQERRK